MLLFLQILLTVFIAEMGDKTQLLMIAMTSRYKLRDILIGAALSILALNAIAVALGAIISQMIPTWIIKLIAGLAFFYFSWSTLKGEEEGDEDEKERTGLKHPILIVFSTFFLAEFGDKTQLTAIAFAASIGLSQAISIWLACSIGLFAADLIGMLVGHIIKEKLGDGFLDKLAIIIFAIFGFTTVAEGVSLLGAASAASYGVAGAVAAAFVVISVITVKAGKKAK